MKDCWNLFAATGAPVFYLLYRRGTRWEEECRAPRLNAVGRAEDAPPV